jgi:hypothetical protein
LHEAQAQVSLTTPAEGTDDLVQGQDAVAAIAAQAVPEPRQDLAPPHTEKVVLDVRARESGGQHRARR